MKQRKCNALSKKLGEDSGLTSITEKMVIIGNFKVSKGYETWKQAFLDNHEMREKHGIKVLAYGKASMTGMRGSIQHASALIHTLHFGNKFRDAVGGTSYLSFTNVRGLAASKISIPMMHKTDPGLRQFYLTHEFTIHDAPGPAELVIAIGASTTPQAHHRIGNRYEDEKEMGLK